MANQPAHEIRLGRIKAVIWMNKTESGLRLNTTISKVYRIAEDDRKSGDDGWRETQSFAREDLLLVAKVADMACTWIYVNGG